MDFSKKGTLKKQQQIKSTSKRVASKIRVSLFRLLLISIVFIAIVGVFAGFGILKGLADSAPSIDQINVAPTRYTTKIRDREGKVIDTLIGAEANREYATIDQIPDVLQKCVISIEDARFYEHDGIDLRGIFRAGLTVFKGGIDNAEGASTITQQLLKNQVFNGGAEDNNIDRIVRKIQEQYLAIQLENKYDKDSILEYYLNTINLGAGTYGVRTASKRYFNKDVSKLTLSESAVIAAIAKSPTKLNPITHPEDNAERRALILDNMKNLGYCSEDEYTEAVNDDVYSRIQSVNEVTGAVSYNSYFVDELIEQVMDDLQEKGFTYTQAYNALYSGGLTIYSTLDSQVQSIVDDVYSDESFFPTLGKDAFWELTYALSIEKADGTTIHYHMEDLAEYFKADPTYSTYYTNKEDAQARIDKFKEAKVEEDDSILAEKINLIIQPQSSMVIIDQTNGQVVALVGGRGEKTGNRTLNRATNTARQPGSTFKVLSTYLPALDSANMTLATVIDDAPYKYPDSDKYVSNWNGESYEGFTTLRQAIYNSMNIVTVKTLAKVTPQVGFDYLKKLGFTTLVDTRTTETGRVLSDINLPMALGGITDGVTNLELTAAFASIANKGVYTKPTLYTKILDHDGNVLLENEPTTLQVMKESTSYLLTSAMEDVVTKGTGKPVKFTQIAMPVAGKTGTTSSNIDTWFAGFTPYYTASVWSGYDNNRKQTNTSYHKRLWKEIMERIHIEKDLEVVPFTIPDSIVTAKICTKSGKLAIDGLCDKYEGGSTVRTEYFAKGTVPTEKCDVHFNVTICKDSHLIATENCPKSSVEEVVLLKKEETSPTKDTPYLLPTKTCNIHLTPSSPLPTDLPGLLDSINTPGDPTNSSDDDSGDSLDPNEIEDDTDDSEFYFDYNQ